MLDKILTIHYISITFNFKRMEMLENINDYDTIILGFGAHTVKNRCIEQLIPLFDTGKIDAIVTNGASVVHDTEIGFNDDTSEDVEATIKEGKFGWDRDVIWELNGFIKQCRTTSLGMMVGGLIGWKGQYRNKSIFWHCNQNNIQPVVSIGIGHDIFQMYQNFDVTSWSEASYQDFKSLTKIIDNAKRGLFVCVGSKVFVPMVIEKAFSIAKNNGSECKFDSLVCDLFTLDQVDGSEYTNKDTDKAGYYERQLKTFGRISEDIEYWRADNRAVYERLYQMIMEGRK